VGWGGGGDETFLKFSKPEFCENFKFEPDLFVLFKIEHTDVKIA